MKTCWIHRLLISHYADVNCKLRAITQRHIERCHGCLEFYRLCQSLEDTCKCHLQTAGTESSDVRAVPAASHDDLPGHKHQHRWLLAAACLGIVAAIATISFVMNWSRSESSYYKNTVELASLTARTDFIVELDKSLSSPLLMELQLLTDEADSAVNFVICCVGVDIPNEGPVENQPAHY